MAGELIPPSIITVEADDSSFLATIAKDTGILDKWASTVTQTQLAASSGLLTDDLATAKTELLDFAKSTYDANLGADADKFWSEIAGLRATLDAMSPMDVDVDANITAALAKLAILKGDLASAMTGSVLTDVAGGAAGSTSSSGLLAAILGRTGGSSLQELLYGGETGSFMSKLLSPLTMLSTLFSAKFGSLGSLAGFGTEHLAITAGSLAGLGVAGGAGAGLLALGNIGKDVVGGGADTLASHETLSNVQALIAGTTTYDALVKKVGVDGAQAASQLASAWKNTTSSFDKDSGPAQLAFSKIAQSLLKVADSYLPMIAAAAQRNFGIIDKAIQPLLKWLEGTGSMQGKGIFAQLEKDFSGGLATSVTALSQGFEHLMRVIDIAAGYTGTFMKAWGQKEALTSTTAGIEKTRSTIAKLITDFKNVDAFLKILGKDLVDVFHNDAGTATAVLKLMTHALQDLGKWINSVGGSNDLKDLFNVHKGETLTLMKSLGDLLVSFGKTYLSITPEMVEFATGILKIANALFSFAQKIPGVGPLVAIITGLTIMELKSKTLSSALGALERLWKLPGQLLTDLKSVGNQLSLLPTRLGLVGLKVKEVASSIGSWISSAAKAVVSAAQTSAAWVAAAAKTTGAWVASAAKTVATWIARAAKAVASAAATAASWVSSAAKTTAAWVIAAAKQVGLWVASAVKAAISAGTTATAWVSSAVAAATAWVIANAVIIGVWVIIIAAVAAAVLLIIKYHKDIEKAAVAVWHTIESAAKAVWSALTTAGKAFESAAVAVWHAIESAGSTVWDGIKTAATAVYNFLTSTWGKIESSVKSAFNSVVSFLKSVGSKIVGAFSGAATWLLSAGKDIINGLIKGIENMAGAAVDAVKKVGSDIISGAKDILHIFSPSTDFQQIGQYVVQGLNVGLADSGESSQITTTLTTLSTNMLNVFKSQDAKWQNAGLQAGNAFASGLRSSSSAITAAITSIVSTAVTAAVSQVNSQLTSGVVKGISAGAGLVNG